MSIILEEPPENVDEDLRAYLIRMFTDVDNNFARPGKFPERKEMPYKPQIGDVHYFGDPSTHSYDAAITVQGFWGYTVFGWVQLGGLMDFGLEVARGNISGLSRVNKFGRNPDVDTTQEDIWDGGGTYTWSTTNDITHAVSDNAGDTMDIEVQGLDVNWALVTQTVTLTGTTGVALTTPLLRVFRMRNLSATAASGNIQVGVGAVTSSFTAANLRAQITQGYEQTLMSLYTIPAGKTGYLMNFWGNMNRSVTTGACDVSIWSRIENGIFRIQSPTGLVAGGSSHFQHRYETYPSYPAKTDIKMTAEGSTNNFDISSGFDLYLVDD